MGLVALRHVGSSRTRNRTRVPYIGRRILNHCATREILFIILFNTMSSVGTYFIQVCKKVTFPYFFVIQINLYFWASVPFGSKCLFFVTGFFRYNWHAINCTHLRQTTDKFWRKLYTRKIIITIKITSIPVTLERYLGLPGSLLPVPLFPSSQKIACLLSVLQVSFHFLQVYINGTCTVYSFLPLFFHSA